VDTHPLGPADAAWKLAVLEDGWGGPLVARLGELVDAAPLAGFVAVEDGERVGLLTYAERVDGVEVVTLQATAPGRGAGRALMDRAYEHAVARRLPRLWLITTNDNIRAIRFYQQWGMDLRRLVHDGVAASRRVKPSIPDVGHHGIALRHELELERLV
jgi:ribosomal protein S18 acetylase RimI-like enzyme